MCREQIWPELTAWISEWKGGRKKVHGRLQNFPWEYFSYPHFYEDKFVSASH